MLTRLIIVLLLTAAYCSEGCASRSANSEASRNRGASIADSDRIRSMTFSSSQAPEPGTLQDLRELGVSHVTLLPFGFQRGVEETTVHFNPNGRWYTESDSGIIEIAAHAGRLGMGIILKPHIWIGGWHAEGQRRDMIGFDSDAAWSEWENSYRKFILHYARLAQRIGADVFVIGTELATAARARPDFWRSVATDVRGVFKGKLSYAANWFDEFEHIAFWPELDYVGVQAYFPISTQRSPTLNNLKSGWKRPLLALQRISDRTGRPVLFTEIGYRSVSDAAREPWRWASRSDPELENIDLQLQSDLYTAFFDQVWTKDWFAGASLWRWHSSTEGHDPVRLIDFTPQGKPALEVIRARFHEPGSTAHPEPMGESPPFN